MAEHVVGLGGKISEGVLWIITFYCFACWCRWQVDLTTPCIKKNYNVSSFISLYFHWIKQTMTITQIPFDIKWFL